MSAWLAFVDPVRAALFALTHVTGGSVGAAILVLSLLVRAALFPLTLRLARQAARTDALLRAAKPQLDAVQARWAADPVRLFEETRRVQREHGIRPVSRAGLLNVAIQLPLGAAVLRAVTGGIARAGRLLWIADLARPDAWLAALAGASAALVTALAPVPAGGTSSRGLVFVSAAVTLFVVWRMAAGVGLYWVGTNVAGVAQTLVLRRLVPRPPRD
jgi:YidC/Oxa1 family membrane protein insertase